MKNKIVYSLICSSLSFSVPAMAGFSAELIYDNPEKNYFSFDILNLRINIYHTIKRMEYFQSKGYFFSWDLMETIDKENDKVQELMDNIEKLANIALQKNNQTTTEDVLDIIRSFNIKSNVFYDAFYRVYDLNIIYNRTKALKALAVFKKTEKKMKELPRALSYEELIQLYWVDFEKIKETREILHKISYEDEYISKIYLKVSNLDFFSSYNKYKELNKNISKSIKDQFKEFGNLIHASREINNGDKINIIYYTLLLQDLSLEQFKEFLDLNFVNDSQKSMDILFLMTMSLYKKDYFKKLLNKCIEIDKKDFSEECIKLAFANPSTSLKNGDLKDFFIKLIEEDRIYRHQNEFFYSIFVKPSSLEINEIISRDKNDL